MSRLVLLLKGLLMPVLLLLNLYGVTVTPVQAAEKVYRCGDTFSQVPCAPDAKELNVRADGSKAPTSSACVDQLRQEFGASDPGSLRITASSDGKLAPFEYAGTKILARHYQFSVVSRLPNGGYQTVGRYACVTSDDGFRVLSLQAEH